MNKLEQFCQNAKERNLIVLLNEGSAHVQQDIGGDWYLTSDPQGVTLWAAEATDICHVGRYIYFHSTSGEAWEVVALQPAPLPKFTHEAEA